MSAGRAMEGGLPIRAGGTLAGAVGVSGAPGGDLDAACAQKAVDSAANCLGFGDLQSSGRAPNLGTLQS